MTQEPEQAPDELDQAVFECLELMEDSGPLGLEQWLSRRPELSGVLRTRLRALGQVGFLGPEPGAEPPRRLGEFQLLASLGGGGMGTVWLARQESLGREVALKVMRADQQFFPEIRRRFEREAAAVSQLRHVGIVPIYAVGEFGGVPYLVMERVRGATLAEVLGELAGRDPAQLAGADLRAALAAALERKGLSDESGRVPGFAGTWPQACANIVEQVARALDHAHERGVLHRDVKPSNVMLDGDGRARLFDFGLARADGSVEITAAGTPVGTLPYMAPEQVAGRAMDRRTDVYGLGALLHDLLALRHPFPEADELARRAAILSGPARGPRATNPAVSRDLDSVCLKALQREPQRRYARAGELADELRAFLEHRPVRARPVGALLRARRWCQRHPTRAVAAAAALAILVGTPSVIATQRGLAADGIQLALDQAQLERGRAEQNLERALETVAFVMGEVGDGALVEVPGTDPARERLVQRSLAMLELSAATARRRGDDSEAWQRLAQSASNLAAALIETGRLREAVPHALQAVELYDRLRGEAPHLRQLDSASLRAAMVLAQARLCDFEYPDADAFERLVEERTPREADARVVLAALMASAMSAARLDASLDDVARADLEREYRDLALSYLETALDMGYAKPSFLERSPEFDVLRDDAEFRSLCGRLLDR